MSLEAERARLETHFKTAWLASAYAAVPVIFENTTIKQPTTDFLIHRIADTDGRQVEITGQGAALHRYNGLLQIDLLIAPGTGSTTAKKMFDVIDPMYSRQQLVDGAGGIMTFRTPSFRSMGLVNERYRFVITCSYHRDIRK